MCRNIFDPHGTELGTMLVGYARTSTLEQEAGLEAQQRDLRAAGVEKIFSEQTSATGSRKGNYPPPCRREKLNQISQ